MTYKGWYTIKQRNQTKPYFLNSRDPTNFLYLEKTTLLNLSVSIGLWERKLYSHLLNITIDLMSHPARVKTTDKYLYENVFHEERAH